ncbi:MAG: OB-fold nucleic acid binding domain-containing protein, partial [Candidatus Altiarchaeota archaeon]
MTEVDDLISRVVAESGKTEAHVKEKIVSRKDKTHGLLSDYGAVYAVAKELGVDLSDNQTKITKLADVSGQKSISIYGRVKVVYSPREFTRKDGSNGLFASLILLDDSGEMRLVLWDKTTETTKHVKVGDTLLVRNAYSRENKGVYEVHAGSLSNIAVNPKVPDVKLPEVSEKLYKVSELSEDNPSVNIVLRVSSYLPKTEFTRSDGSTGARASFIGEDESGKIRVVLWDNAAGTELSDGVVVKIENGYTRKGLSDGIELQAGNRARIVESDVKLKLPKLPEKGKAVKLSGVSKDSSSLTIEARVLRVYPPRAYSGGTMSSLVIGDDSGVMRAVLWDDKADTAIDLARNDAIVFSNAYGRANMNDEVEVHVGKYGAIKKLAESKIPKAEDIELKYTPAKTIAELEPSEERV